MPFSIRSNLIRWLSFTQVIVIVVAGLVSYPIILRQVSAVYDWVLIDSAQSLARLFESRGDLSPDVISSTADILLRTDQYDWIFYAVHDSDGHLIAGDAQLTPLPTVHFEEGVALFDRTVQGQWLRVGAIESNVDGAVILIQVAETGMKRRMLTNRMFIGLVGLLVVLCGISIVLVALGVTQGLRPLSNLRREIEARSFLDLRPIPLRGVPNEVQPMVVALNEWLGRVKASVTSQQHFLANAAHQLRTPLAGLRMRIEQAARDPSKRLDLATIEAIRMSTQRMTHLTNQLLSLARAEVGVPVEQMSDEVALQSLIEDLANEMMARAIRKSIDFGLDLEPVKVSGNKVLIREMVSNLLDNALLYTPPHGKVTVETRPTEAGAELTIENDGPSIPDPLRQQVFERFYRLEGSLPGGCGLGLAIVREIALLHGATISLGEPGQGTGTRVRIVFPSKAPLHAFTRTPAESARTD